MASQSPIILRYPVPVTVVSFSSFQVLDQFMAQKSEKTPFYTSPIQPVELKLDSVIQFDCHKQVSCFNACCRNIDIVITPYDILRLKRRFDLVSRDFVGAYTTPYAMDHHDLPGLKLNTKPGTTECVFLSEEGCTVYEDRPAACRYYALGSMGVRKKDESEVEDIFFIVKEDHCRGHEEPRQLTVAEYRSEQGVDKYDEMNEQWRDVILKKRSSGPTVGRPSDRSRQLFDMCSYDMDSFREFIQSPGFLEIYDLSEEQMTTLINDEDALLAFAMRFLKQVLYGEMTIAMKPDARAKRMQRMKERIDDKQADSSSTPS